MANHQNIFITVLFYFNLVFSLNQKEAKLIEWNSTNNKCIPDVCRGSNILEIAGYDKQMPVSLIESTTIYDTNKTRACLKDKYIAMIGDSSLIETTHDIIQILTRIVIHDNILNYYWNECVGYSFQNFTNSIIQVPNDSTFSIKLHPTAGHRNLTFTLSDYNMYLRLRFNGGSKLPHNWEGLLGM